MKIRCRKCGKYKDIREFSDLIAMFPSQVIVIDKLICKDCRETPKWSWNEWYLNRKKPKPNKEVPDG